MMFDPKSFAYFQVLMGTVHRRKEPSRNDPNGEHIHVVSVAHQRFLHHPTPLLSQFHNEVVDEYLSHLPETEFTITGQPYYTNVYFKDESEAMEFYLKVS